MAETKTDLVLTQGQYAYVQETTKGTIKVHVGPAVITPSQNESPVRYDGKSGRFVSCNLNESACQSPIAPEDSYLVLENPAKEDVHPSGTANVVDLQVGRKININGPVTFALWPTQTARVIQGHQMKSNEYIVVRVYNIDEAKKNWPHEAFNEDDKIEAEAMVIGQLLVIKGTDVSFFIPPTGLEVMPGSDGAFVRKAVTLERLEYCILLDEDGNKRYEIGPSVVFPKATEAFVMKPKDSAAETPGGEPGRSVKFKAIELNDQMGLYIKVIADYEEEILISAILSSGNPGVVKEWVASEGAAKKSTKTISYKAGDELFITGKDQRIYYPRPEHAIISYGDEKAGFARQRYYGVAIPKGEARFVLNKDTGIIRLVRGETVFLPDPRHEVIVRRVLDQKTVNLWYPGNTEAAAYNQALAALTAATANNYVSDLSYMNASLDVERSMNKQTSGSAGLRAPSSIFADTLKRGTQFTPPPTVTLNTKYDGPPVISIWTGYAVQVVDKVGKRRVVQGPDTILLEYDETLERMQLSTGKPKTTDQLYETVYLRVSNNKVSDFISAETKDMVTVGIKVSYRVNFENDPTKWFAVENYVKLLTDHCRSKLRARIKHLSIKDFIDDSSSVVRDVVLGEHEEGTPRAGMAFTENGMRVYDVEVLSTDISDEEVAGLIIDSQQEAVKKTLQVTAKQLELESTKTVSGIEQEIAELRHSTIMKGIELEREQASHRHELQLSAIQENNSRAEEKEKGELEITRVNITRAEEILEQKKQENAETISLEGKRTEFFKERMEAVNDKLATAIGNAADRDLMGTLAQAVAPIAIMEQEGVGPSIRRLLAGTGLAEKLGLVESTNGKK
jgi:major vault protein